MNKQVFQFLKNYSTDPVLVNRLIVTSFLNYNNLSLEKNELLLYNKINQGNTIELKVLKEFEEVLNNYITKFSFENLIELFEFVISPTEKIVNGAIYTPEFIRNFIVNKQFELVSADLRKVKCCDISCGCGGFLLTITNHLRLNTEHSFKEIFKENIYGLDIAAYSVERAKILLSLFALSSGEDENFDFNLYTGNALSFDWFKASKPIRANGGFDLISGNPPYVASRNMEQESLDLMSNWSVAKSGHPDLYIPFFQIGYHFLKSKGILGYITVNTFIKSINGRALRLFLGSEKPLFHFINFAGEQIFKGRNTYTCLCFISKNPGSIKYLQTESSNLENITEEVLQVFDYKDLDHFSGWNLTNSIVTDSFIKQIENTGIKLKDKFLTRNGIATLKNDSYKFTPVGETKKHYIFLKNQISFKIEREVCRDIINANKIKDENDLQEMLEKIIFPYEVDNHGKLQIIPEDKLKSRFPNCYLYLLTQKEILATRDKGLKNYEEWYAYGRRQSMDINSLKLFFPHITTKPRFIISDDLDLLFYNGIAIISDDLQELKFLKVILESDIFYKYILLTTKNYSSGFLSMSKNYIKNFGILDVTEDVKIKIINSSDPNKLLNKLYGLVKS
ncbi:HsdM family class I SAM-dependent methyltransferase [Sphingobacterium detergens]|uniref:site-specific DNA-methyltransferase (adenine-specific) n=1 Tax=Sphingobacterium detergens TaxID=1145106 RepID=A0A420B6U1_SPHD1|nr:DNA methyltransferase [Sphingobacterium detergens]RKE52379.1 Eco57I restriction-modification methylase [Sphingobacterium detergens]